MGSGSGCPWDGRSDARRVPWLPRAPGTGRRLGRNQDTPGRSETQIRAVTVQSSQGMYESGVFLVALAAGAISAISGFGIGSLLTPLFALQVGTKTAVAAASIPHLIG